MTPPFAILALIYIFVGLCSAAPLPITTPRSIADDELTSLQPRGKLYPVGISAPYDFGLVTNDPTYTASAARADLARIMSWAGDTGRLSAAQTTETIAAIFDVANRYYPELPTKAIARAIIADIKSESDFDSGNTSPGREGSGDSLGLMQVSQGGSRELTLFQEHARITTSRAGPLKDYSTGKVLDVWDLSTGDLFRPWINIHVASWIQANLGKTGSLDPDRWSSATDSKASGGLARNMRTAFGSWVAGPHPDGRSAYLNAGDQISAPYLRSIAKGVDVLYGGQGSIRSSWLDGLTLNTGVVDYR
ncbi:hypothetical protein V8E36_005549 [Tilletia maclaganii]